MINKTLISEHNIIDYLKNNFNIFIDTLTPLLLGADLDAITYKAQSNDNIFYFVKLKKASHDLTNLTLQVLLHSAGIKEVLCPTLTKNGAPGLLINTYCLTIYPFIEGINGFDQNLTKNQWISFGKALKKIHTFKVPSQIKSHIKKESYSSIWRDQVQTILKHVKEKSIINDTISLQLSLFIQEHLTTIEHLVNRAQSLAYQIKYQPSPLVLCHADIHAGNVLIQDNKTLYIVDWDQPIMAPKERDLMFIGAGIANTWNNKDDEIFFYEGYGETAINMAILTYYRYERIIEDIAIYSHNILLTTTDNHNKKEMYDLFISMFEPGNVIDKALETNERLLQN